MTKPTAMEINSSSSYLSHFHYCSDSTLGFQVALAYNVARFFVFAPCILVLYLGLQQWRQQRSFGTTTHSDIFTYHSATMELIYTLGEIFYFCGAYTDFKTFIQLGYYLCSILIPGQTSFHILTCLERYLAVVHPIVYLRLRQSGGVRIRNASIGCVWLLCLGWIGVTALYLPEYPYILYFGYLTIALVVVSFCSLSVLCVLIRPGPGETGGKRQSVDQLKQRAFQMIKAVTGVLWLFFLGFLVCLALANSQALRYTDGCVVLISIQFISLPCSLVLPYLFLQRAGKLFCCNLNNG